MGKWGNGTTMPGILTQVKEDSGIYILCKVAQVLPRRDLD